MLRSLSRYFLAALSVSTYVIPVVAAPNTSAPSAQTRPTAQVEMTEEQRIMYEIRKQVGRELKGT